MPYDLTHLAKLGARLRLQELDRERAAIVAAFPDLNRSPSAGDPTPARKRRKLSAAGRAAIIAGVKKRWAAVRKAQAAAK